MSTEKLTSTERRAIAGLSSIMGLRMLGLFMVLPVFSLYAHDLAGATPALIGIAMGIYGLSQAISQISFGSLSDRIGRKPVILIGLGIFAAGSLLAGSAHSIGMMILGRTLQGTGAVGSTSLAMMSDLTREEQRTKSMMFAGISIGLSFSIAMFLGPVLTQWMSVGQLFYIATLLAMLAAVILYFIVPTPTQTRWNADTEVEMKSMRKLFFDKELARLNFGIFSSHAIFTASFVVIPVAIHQISGLDASHQWEIYLPALLCALIVSLTCTGMAERNQQVKQYFLAAVIAIAAAQFILLSSHNTLTLAAGVSVFFAGFTLLESFLPSLVSRTAPRASKGSAMGIYSCAQYSGIFVGGVLGGWLYGKFHFSGVYLFSMTLAIAWSALVYFMPQPRYLVTKVVRLASSQLPHWETFASKLQIIPGMIEVTLVTEDGLAYLKMERSTAKNPDFIRLKEQLNSNHS